MRLITLIRHAKADQLDTSDFARPLSSAGLREATLLAATTANELERPARLFASPALRTMSTARIFAAALAIDESLIVQVPRIYEATAATLLGLIQGLDDACVHAVLFGHNPGISDFARLLADCPFVDMPPCAIVSLRVAARHWENLAPACGGLVRYRHPLD